MNINIEWVGFLFPRGLVVGELKFKKYSCCCMYTPVIHIIILYPHDKAGVGNVVVVCAVGVHELDVEGELGQRDVVVDVMMRVVKPLHLDLTVQKIHSN